MLQTGQDSLLILDLLFFLRIWRKMLMNRDRDGQVAAVRIHIELQRPGSVALKRLFSIRETCVPTFNQMEFLQKVTNPAISVRPCPDLLPLNRLVADASIKARKAGDLNACGRNSNRDWLWDLVGTMIDCV